MEHQRASEVTFYSAFTEERAIVALMTRVMREYDTSPQEASVAAELLTRAARRAAELEEDMTRLGELPPC